MLKTSYSLLKHIGYTSFLVGIIGLRLMVANHTFAHPLYQNGYTECPPQSDTIWVQIIDPNPEPGLDPRPSIDDNGQIKQFSGDSLVVEIPFDSGSVTIPIEVEGQLINFEFQNYIKGVLTGEINNAEPLPNGNAWDLEMLKALVVAVRTKAYDRCGVDVLTDENGIEHRGVLGHTTQEYRYAPVIPGTIYNVSSQTQQNFQNAVDDTEDIYMDYQFDTFSVQYRDRTGNYTSDNPLPHIRVYDPVGAPFEPLERSGLAQINANYWALGNSQGTLFPDWNYSQILAHYYTDIRLREFPSSVLSPVYRWNFLTVDWGGNTLTPPQMIEGQTYPVNIELQNTGLGILPWDQNIKLTYRWLFPSGSSVTGSEGEITLPNVTSFTAGNSTQAEMPVTLQVQAPNQAGQYTLVIDMFYPAIGSGYFANREENRLWYDLRYDNISVLSYCSVFGCDDIYLPLIVNNEGPSSPSCQNHLINGNFDDGLNNWDFVFGPRSVSNPTECTGDNPPVVVDAIKAARLGRCDNNFDILSQDVTLSANHPGAMYLYVDWVVATLEQDPPVDGISDQFQISIEDGNDVKVIKLVGSEFGYSDGDGDGISDWQNLTYNLQSYNGKTIKLKFLGFNDPLSAGPDRDPTDFFIDNVAVNICN